MEYKEKGQEKKREGKQRSHQRLNPSIHTSFAKYIRPVEIQFSGAFAVQPKKKMV